MAVGSWLQTGRARWLETGSLRLDASYLQAHGQAMKDPF